MSSAARRAGTNPPGPGHLNGDRRRRATRVASCLAAAGATIAFSGCSGSGGSHSAAGAPATTTTAASPTMSSTTAPGGRATTAGAPAVPVRTGSPGDGTLPFAADISPDVSTVQDGSPVLVSVTKGIHDGYIRYVFRFNHSDPDGHQPWRQFARPAWDVGYVSQAEAVMDGSGQPVPNAGAHAHLRIRFDANMHDGAEGQNTLQASVSDDDALVFGGDFEGHVRWFYGAPSERPFRVFYAGDGRVAVDVVN